MNLNAYANYPHIEKIWGTEIVLTNNHKYCSKLMVLKEGFQCSLHKHFTKDETFFVLQGKVLIESSTNPNMLVVASFGEGQNKHIAPNTYHRFSALLPDTILLEVSTSHSDEDVSRFLESGPVLNGPALPY